MKKKNNINITIIVIIILIILGGTFVVVRDYINRTKNHYTFKGANGEDFNFEIFKIENNTWHKLTLYLQEKDEYHEYILSFRYGPNEVEDISIEEGVKEKLFKSWIYLTQDSELMNKSNGRSLAALLELGRITGTSNYGIFQINTQIAYTKENNIVLTKSCKDVNQEIAVVEARLGEKNKVYTEGECIILEGVENEDLIKVADKFTYQLLGLF